MVEFAVEADWGSAEGYRHYRKLQPLRSPYLHPHHPHRCPCCALHLGFPLPHLYWYMGSMLARSVTQKYRMDEWCATGL